MPPDEEKLVTAEHCDKRSGEILEAIREFGGELREVNIRLFKDNGRKSHQTILNDHDRVIKMLIWVVTVASGAFIAGVITLIISKLSG